MASSARVSNKAGSSDLPRIALVLQGGGALGAYHIGVYQALHEAGLEPDWFSGISIGAINSCILAGNLPEHRLAKLEELWDDISRPEIPCGFLPTPLKRVHNTLSFMSAAMFGQPNFWTTRIPSPVLFHDLPTEQASYCDTSMMIDTLQRLSSFELINQRAARLSLGATKVTTGELVFFDNQRQEIRPQHVLASGSLPPGFPATEVDGELYWDGGCVSNTPLDAIFSDAAAGDTLVFMIDLWDSHGKAPRSMEAVSWRQKQIQYASRTSHHVHSIAVRHNLMRALHHVKQKAKVDIEAVSDDVLLDAHNGQANFDIVHLVYQPAADQISDSDAEFSRTSIQERRDAGYADMQRVIEQAPWQSKKAAHQGTSVHTARQGKVMSACPA